MLKKTLGAFSILVGVVIVGYFLYYFYKINQHCTIESVSARNTTTLICRDFSDSCHVPPIFYHEDNTCRRPVFSAQVPSEVYENKYFNYAISSKDESLLVANDCSVFTGEHERPAFPRSMIIIGDKKIDCNDPAKSPETLDETMDYYVRQGARLIIEEYFFSEEFRKQCEVSDSLKMREKAFCSSLNQPETSGYFQNSYWVRGTMGVRAGAMFILTAMDKNGNPERFDSRYTLEFK